MYQKLSADIHHPGLEAVPIQVRFLGPNHAAMMIRCCEEAVVAYAIYDAGGVHVAAAPPEVARLLVMEMETAATEGDDLGGTGPLEVVDAPPPPEGGVGKKGTGTRKKGKNKKKD
jgi:hypothetical protein